MEMEWNNQLGHRSRRAWLLLVKEGKIYTFSGQDIPQVCVIKGYDYKQNGKWSSTTYRLLLADGVRPISGHDGWETGRFAEGVRSGKTPDTWEELSKVLGVDIVETISFLEAFRPSEAKKFHETERKLSELELSGPQDFSEVVHVEVTFGGPSNRQIADGYWERPKAVPGYPAEVRKDAEGNWTIITGMSGKVINTTHIGGFHGGYYKLTVALVPGTEVEIPPFLTALELEAEKSEDPELFLIFSGNVEKVEQLKKNLEVFQALAHKADRHELGCGRERFRSEVVRVTGNPEFFLGVDPLKLQGIILESSTPTPAILTDSRSRTSSESEKEEDEDTPFAAALKKAGLA